MLYFDKTFIADKIKYRRKKLGLTQSKLTKKIGISEKHLSKIETGKNYPSLDNFFKIAEVLELSFSDFGISSSSTITPAQNNLIKKILCTDDATIKIYTKAIAFADEIYNNK